MGYIFIALFTSPFAKAYQWKDIPRLWKAYCDGIHEKLGFEKFRIENDVEFETRINDFMIDKNVVSVQSLKDSVFVTYTD